MQEFITACPRNCYSTCTFRVFIKDGKIRRILPFPGNLATPEGPCIKGLSYLERAHSPDRILKPLIRSGNGHFRQVSQEEALEVIAERLMNIKSVYGPHSILWYRGSGNSGLTNEIGSKFWKNFGGATTTYGNLCWPAGLEAVRLTLGSVKHNVPWDIVNAKTIVIWGKNPAETNIQEMAFIGKARENGATVICIDPRRTPTADKADLLFTPSPGTDAALALSVASVIIETGKADSEFISRYVTGYDLYCKSSLVSPADGSAICGIPEDQIRRLAGLIATGGPVTFLPGYGLQRYRNGGQTIRSILALAIITGNLGKPGAGFNFANLQSYVFDKTKEPLSYYPDEKKDAPFRRKISMARLGEDMRKLTDPPLKALWVERGNPVLQAPHSKSVLKAFSDLEFRVVIEQFMTDTAKMADVILPAKDIFEQSDIIGSYWSPYVQFKPKITEPEGEIMPETEVYYRLAVKMGLNIPDQDLPGPGNDNIEKWLEMRIRGMCSLTLDDLRRGPVIPPDLEEIAYSDHIFDTPSGKIEMCSPAFSDKWGISEYPEYVDINPGTNKNFPLVFISPNTGSRIHSQFGNLDAIRKNVAPPAVYISPRDAAERGINDGDSIAVYNEHGTVRSRAEITGRIKNGIVILHNGIWIGEGGGSNFLTAPHETDIGFGAAFHGVRVEVSRITEE